MRSSDCAANGRESYGLAVSAYEWARQSEGDCAVSGLIRGVKEKSDPHVSRGEARSVSAEGG